MPRLRRLTPTICAFHLGFGLVFQAGNLDEAAVFVGAAILFGVLMPIYLFRMGRTGEDLLGWENEGPEGRE